MPLTGKARTPEAGVALELRIDRLAAGGEGVGVTEVDGERRAVFVRGTAPGDLVRVETITAGRPMRARVVRLIEPGPGRAQAPCPDVRSCGGCDWMHLGHDAQREAHLEVLRTALPAALATLPVSWHPSSRREGYRTRARLHVQTRGGARPSVGMHQARSHRPVPVAHCVVLAPELERLRLRLPELLDGARGSGEAQIALASPPPAKDAPARLPVLDLRWTGDLPTAMWGRLEQATRAGELAGARVWIEGARTPATIGDPRPWIAGADGAPLELAPGGFAQAHEEGNEAFVRRIAELAEPTLSQPNARAIELFAGAGNLTVLLARSRAELTAVESDALACAAARNNLAARGLSARIVLGDARTYRLPPRADLVVLDPPRTGAREVMDAIVSARVRNVVYAACDPPTLGRDLERLTAAGYVGQTVDAFEMFPHTSHLEVVVALARAIA